MTENAFSASENALEKNTVVNNYQIKLCLNEDFFGITYTAHHRKTGEKVILREYFPREFVAREEDNTIKIKEKDEAKEVFEYGLQAFQTESEKLKTLKHKNLAEVKDCFEDNNTSYRVTKYYQGQTLKQWITLSRSLNKPRLSEKKLLNIIVPLLNAMTFLDENDYLHQNIRPENIYLSNTDIPLLIGFGASKRALANKIGKKELALGCGYAPQEQYTDEDVTACADIYALSASLYYATTYEEPISALERTKAYNQQTPEPLIFAVQAGKNDYRKEFLEVIDHGLAYLPSERPQSFAEFKDLLIEQQYKNRKKKTTYQKQPSTENKKASQVSELILLGLLLYILTDKVVKKVDTLDVPMVETAQKVTPKSKPKQAVSETITEETRTDLDNNDKTDLEDQLKPEETKDSQTVENTESDGITEENTESDDITEETVN